MKNLDPKQRQQLVVLTLLFLAALGYAGYQLFFPGSTGASTRPSTEQSASTTEQAKQPPTAETQTLATGWNPAQPARDPFVVPPQFDNLRNNALARTTPPPPRVASVPNVGTLPPMPVTPMPSATLPPNLESPRPSAPTQSPAAEGQTPSIKVTGVVIGSRPVAIIRAEDGKQRIVQPGYQIEGGYTLRAISREGITIEKDGQTITLGPGGQTHAK